MAILPWYNFFIVAVNYGMHASETTFEAIKSTTATNFVLPSCVHGLECGKSGFWIVWELHPSILRQSLYIFTLDNAMWYYWQTHLHVSMYANTLDTRRFFIVYAVVPATENLASEAVEVFLVTSQSSFVGLVGAAEFPPKCHKQKDKMTMKDSLTLTYTRREPRQTRKETKLAHRLSAAHRLQLRVQNDGHTLWKSALQTSFAMIASGMAYRADTMVNDRSITATAV